LSGFNQTGEIGHKRLVYTLPNRPSSEYQNARSGIIRWFIHFFVSSILSRNDGRNRTRTPGALSPLPGGTGPCPFGS
jgi:hypothetical protein